MNHDKCKALYAELKQFEGGIKNVANTLDFTPEHVRLVMCVHHTHKSKTAVFETALLEIKKRRAEQAERLKKIFSDFV